MTALQIVQKFYPEVTAVKDAARSVEIEVLPKDINSSAVRNHKQCAFAVACKRMVHADAALISVKMAYMINGTTATRYQMPESLSREIVAFDRDGHFSAGAYFLRKPTRKIGAQKKRGPHATKSGRTTTYRHATQGIRQNLSTTP